MSRNNIHRTIRPPDEIYNVKPYRLDGGNEGNGHSVFYYDKELWIEGEQANTADMEHTVVLTPKEALSLLAWLGQERETLEKLVKKGE